MKKIKDLTQIDDAQKLFKKIDRLWGQRSTLVATDPAAPRSNYSYEDFSRKRYSLMYVQSHLLCTY